MSDYTPSLYTVRELYAWQRSTLDRATGKRVPSNEYDAEFDRWLAAHDADLRERIATEIEGLAKSSPYAGQFNEAVFSAADIARGKDQA